MHAPRVPDREPEEEICLGALATCWASGEPVSSAEPHPRSLKHLDALLERQPSGTPLLQEFYRDREIFELLALRGERIE